VREKILALLSKKGDIPPLPDILRRLSAKINDPECDLIEIADLIKTEPILAGRLNNMANSVFYGGGLDKSRDISTAVMRLGLKLVMDLAYALEVPKMFLKTKGMDQRQFWRHSLAVAILSKIIGKKLLSGKKDQENAYLAGLMHDMGMLVFCFLIPEEYAEFLKTVPSLDGTLEQLESAKFGINHFELGGLFISKQWNLEAVIVKAVKDCNSDSLNMVPASCSLAVTFADNMVNDAGIIVGVKTKTLVPVRKDVLKSTGISTDDMNEMLKEMKKGLESMEVVLNGK
jgi:HD-like signal output (HDOD) protein